MAKMKECPICGIRVKLENLEHHIRRVHPKVDLKSVLSDDERITIKKVRKKSAGIPFDEREKQRWAIAGGVVVVAVLAVVLMVATLPPPGGGGEELVGKPAPLFIYNDVDNIPYDLNEHIGPRLILLEFFYTQCSFCIEMHPNLEELYEYYGWGDRLEIVSISADPRDSFQDVRNFRDVRGSNWTFISAPSSLGETYQITGTPTMYLIGYDGTIVERIFGYKSVSTMKNIIEEHL